MSEKTSDLMVSVCIANYNGMDIIDGCIESVLAQDLAESVEIIVHDDASTDGSAEHIRTRYPEVLLIESLDNAGFCVANNRMAAHAQGDYILLLNNDAELLPDALYTLLTAAQTTGKSAILTLPQFNANTGEIIDRGCLLDPFYNPVPNLDPDRGDVAMVIGACFWIPKQLWNELGGFPNWFGSIGEDLYLCCRARLAGYPVRVIPASGYQHWIGMSFGGGKILNGRLTTTYRRRAMSERNKTMVMVMTCPTPVLPLLVPFHLMLLIIEGTMVAILRGSIQCITGVYLPVFQSLWQNRKRVAIERKIIMAQRKISCLEFFSLFKITPYKLRMLLRYGLPRLE